jgi:hypothetical protein
VMGGKVVYQINGVTLMTSAAAPVYPLMADTSMYSSGSTFPNVGLGGAFA